MRETKLFKILSFIHLTVVLSMCFFGVSIVSLTILMIPALCAAFAVGRDLIENKFNVYDGLVKKFFVELKNYLKALRFLPVWLMILLQAAGIAAAAYMQSFWLQIVILVMAALLLTYLYYACAYMVFLPSPIRYEEILIRMFGNVKILFSLFCLSVLLLIFFQLRFLPVLFFFGAVLILIIEAVIYLTIKDELENKEESGEDTKE